MSDDGLTVLFWIVLFAVKTSNGVVVGDGGEGKGKAGEKEKVEYDVYLTRRAQGSGPTRSFDLTGLSPVWYVP